MVTAPVASDWLAVGNSLQPVLADWKANNIDAQLQPLYSRISPSMVYPANITADQIQQIVQSVQVFQPGYQVSHLQTSLNFMTGQSPSAISSVLGSLQSGGFAYYMNGLIEHAPNLATYFASGGPSASVKAGRQGEHPDATCPKCQPGNGDGGDGWSCAKDGALIATAATAFLVLTVMSGGLFGIEGVLAFGWWGGIASWGGAVTGAWSAGHYAAGCSF